MNSTLAQKITTEISRFSAKKYAITDKFGNVMAKTDDFSLSYNPLEIKSKKSFPILFDNHKLGYLFIDENPATVAEIGPILKSMADLISRQDYYADFLTQDEKKLDQLMFEYFRLESQEKRELEKMIHSLGVSLKKNRLAILLEINDPNFLFLTQTQTYFDERERKIAHIKRELKFILSSFYTHHSDNVISYLGGSTFLVLKDMGDIPKDYEIVFKKTLNTLFYNFKKELRTDISMGIGQYKPGDEGIKESFEEAETALKFGTQNWGKNNLYHFDSFGVVAPLFSGATKANISVPKKIVKTLRAHKELLESLEAYFNSNISISKTAQKLKIHRNTLIYRLERIEELTGNDPRIFNEAFELYIALMLDKYAGDK